MNGLKKGLEQLTEDIREIATIRRKEESGTSNASVQKKKRKMDDGEYELVMEYVTLDKSKYKKLEMLIS